MTRPADLIHFLLAHYDLIKRRISYRVGSLELAEDVMQDTYLRLHAHVPSGPVRNPSSFVLRTALNLAIDRIRADRRLLTGEEVEFLIEQEMDPVDPAAAAAGRLDLDALARALDRLPAQRRQLFMASRFDGVPQKELARHYGISLRKVELEIHRAHEYLAEQIQRKKTD
ncbi:RNA polymerase sigma factor [Pseudothauera rhizosphaerae]|uniref:RNA polymerase sigma factor n=1 Tax=Pseudothauera rhizosphaerae TaxID=2565932 RepID=A0A4S4AHB2_9RHOO|nr:RNA polymerase sigma factor [Pseudothauera rhizosphaerae]THF58670.1 RNA polymerase sigma factor [Pseudothauera rhizosphaerae]